MQLTTVFVTNRTQAVRLPADLRLPDHLKQVVVRARGMERIISPANAVWDSFFDQDPTDLAADFLEERAEQVQADRESF